METRYIFDAIVEELYLHNGCVSTIIVCYGKIAFFDLNGRYYDLEDDYGYKRKPIGKLIKPRWKKFVLDWVDRGYVNKIEDVQE